MSKTNYVFLEKYMNIKLLRESIRNIILENYQLSDEEKKKAEKLGISFDSNSLDVWDEIKFLFLQNYEGFMSDTPDEEDIKTIDKFLAQAKKLWSERPKEGEEKI